MGVNNARSQWPNRKEGAAEGGIDNWGEVVTRYPYRTVRLDHLLSKEEEVGVALLFRDWKIPQKDSGGDALRGNTRTHPEHDG